MSTIENVVHVRLHAPGNARSLRVERVPVPDPGPGQIRLRHTAIGVNFVDVYHRSGLYPLPALPATLGVEGVGVVESVGPGVDGLRPGQRVAYAGLPVGGYSEVRLLPASAAIALPDGIADELGAASLLRGITAHMLFTRVWTLRPGHTVLVQAAAGGLGLVLTQWARALGARVIGTVSTDEKAGLAKAHGLHVAVNRRREDVVEAARAFGDGMGVDLAVDGIGGAALLDCLDAVRPFGMVASVGQAAGDLPPLPLQELGPARSIALARPSVFRHMADAVRYRQSAEAVLGRLSAGLQVPIGARLPLSQAAEAHALLESGQGTGAVVLVP
jgi:NADPH2:quinone reductase